MTQREATNVARVGDAVAAALCPQYQAVTTNQIAYIDSFTVTQNQMLAVLEKVTGKKFEIKHHTTQAIRVRASERLQKGDRSAGLDVATAPITGLGETNEYSKEMEI